MANPKDYAWHKCLYDEEWNPALYYLKRFFRWSYINFPDASLMEISWKRQAMNITVIIVTAGLASWILMTEPNIIVLLIKIYVVSWLPGLLYFRMVSHAILWGIERYQRIAKGLFRNF